MTNKNKQQLAEFKVKISELGNYASKENIEMAILIIKQLLTYISVDVQLQGQKDAYESFQILLNWIESQPIDTNNGTMMIVLKENFLENIELLLKSTNRKEFKHDKHDNRTKNNKVFIVHGHKDEMKLAVSMVLGKLGLEPIILHEQPDRNRTIIEKFEDEAGKSSFAIVLISPDDKVGIVKEKPFRARQNVILELGYFIGSLGRKNVLALYDVSKNEEIELPSDIAGILYTPYDNPYGNWRFALANELRAAGYNIDINNL